MLKEKIVNVETGEETWRDYTAEEIAKVEEAIAKSALEALQQAEKIAAKKAIFEKLGITEDEAKLLLS